MDNLAVDFHQAFVHINANGRSANDARDAKLTGDHSSMGGGAAFTGDNTLGRKHPMNIIWLGKWTNHDHSLLVLFVHQFSGVRVKINLANGSARGSIHPGSEQPVGFLSGFNRLGGKLRMQ